MTDLDGGHDNECIRRMYQDAGVTMRCECGDTNCLARAKHNVPASRLFDEDCGEPATMQLYQVIAVPPWTPLVEGRPIDFCNDCGDNALQSGAFATSEDVAVARRKEETD